MEKGADAIVNPANRQHVEQTFGYDLTAPAMNSVRYRHVETCQQTVPEAIIASFWKAPRL